MPDSFTDILQREAVRLISPLESLATPEELLPFIIKLGPELSILDDVVDLGLDNLVTSVSDLITRIDDDPFPYESLLDTLVEIKNVAEKAQDLIPQLDQIDITEERAAELGQLLLRRLCDFLIYHYTLEHHPKIFAFFHLLGLAETIQTYDELKAEIIQWERFGTLFTDPIQIFNDTYSWDRYFNGDELLNRLVLVLQVMRLPGDIYRQTENIRTQLGRSAWDDKEIRYPVFMYSSGDSFAEIDLNLSPVPEIEESKAGMFLYPYFVGEINLEGNISDNWSFKLAGNAELNSGLGLEIRPPTKLKIKTGIFESHENFAESTNTRIELGISRKIPNDHLQLIFGEQEGTHLGYQSVGAKLIASTSQNGQEISIELNIDHLELAISAADGDGFIQKLLSGINVDVFFDLAFGVSNLDGVYFKGSGGLEIEIPIHQKLGPIDIDSLFIKFGIGDKIEITLATSLGAELGPIQASIQKIGLKIPLEIKGDMDGNFGPLDISLPKFKPPNGVGLALKSDFISGGGFLEMDDVNKRYTGILELKAGEIGITAIGLIATRMPDGSDGFSMLVSIGVTFSPPFQLSFGFVLGGVGGLMGLNRYMITDVLRDGLKNRTLDSILFPEDPIANASKIISDLRSVFPPEESRFVIGPMVKIGWATPTLITVDIGIFIEIPSPIRIVLLGEIAATFPSPETTIIEIHIDVLGVIDFGKKQLSIDASIYDSRIYKLVLAGDAALRLSWGDNSVFVVSLGGFHPRFSPPPSLGAMARLSLNISQSSSLQIGCWTYLALTSNSFQFGAGVDFYVKACGASIEGGMSFDALIYFNPFAFYIDMAGHLVIRFKGYRLAGVYLSLSLSGPSPWHAMGSATIAILFWDITVDFDATWGKSDNERLPSIDPWLGKPGDDIMGLNEALKMNGSWGSRLPENTHMFESFKEIEPNESDDSSEPQEPEIILVHPCGRLEIHQKILPFGIHLEKLGNNPVHGHNDFTIKLSTNIGGTQQDLSGEPLMEDFSRGQFKNLNKIQRLSLPSFEKMQSGLVAGSDTVYFAEGKSVHKELVYESILINPDLTSEKANNKEANDQKMLRANWMSIKHQLRGNATKRSGALNAGKGKYSALGKSSKVTITQEGYIIVRMEDLSPIAFNESWPINDGCLNRTKADELLQKYLQEHPDEELQVISTFELEEVA